MSLINGKFLLVKMENHEAFLRAGGLSEQYIKESMKPVEDLNETREFQVIEDGKRLMTKGPNKTFYNNIGTATKEVMDGQETTAFMFMPNDHRLVNDVTMTSGRTVHQELDFDRDGLTMTTTAGGEKSIKTFKRI